MTTHVNMEETRSARFAMRCASWAEKWFPDSWVFAVVGIFIVVLAAFAIGAPVQETSKAFGKGFWSLIPFTMQMAFVVIGGYVVASSKPASALIKALARVPKTGRGAVAWVAATGRGAGRPAMTARRVSMRACGSADLRT